MKRIRLSLTGCGEVLKESAEKKLEQVDNSYQTPTCSNGKTAEFYDDIGIPLPQDLVDKIKNQSRGIEFSDDDYESVTTDIVVYEDEIKLMITDDEFTTIFLRDGLTITVLEEAEAIDDYISYMQRSQFTKFVNYISYFFRRIKNKYIWKNK